MATILIGADLCPIGSNLPYFERGDAQTLFNDLLPDIQSADLAIANLECPLITEEAPIMKTGPNFGAPPAAIEAIRKAGIDVLTLANNHIMDHGAGGLKTTMDACATGGILTVGAGKDLAAARRILIQNVAGVRIGIMGMAEHEFSIATRNSWGANPINLIDYVRNVRESRDKFDFLIVLLHGGQEFHVPSPKLKETCKFLIETGANAVVVQHPHCLGGYEEYLGGHIVYGQGALIMDEDLYRGLPSFHEGFLVRLEVGTDFKSAMEIIPFTHSVPSPGARKMSSAVEKTFRKTIAERSAEVKDDAKVERRWLQFCRERRHSYLSSILGHNKIIRKLNARGVVTRALYSPRQLLSVKNLVRCETHRETLETIFADDAS